MCWCNIKSRWRKMMGSFLQPTFLLRRLLSNHSDFSAKSVVKDWTSSFPPFCFLFFSGKGIYLTTLWQTRKSFYEVVSLSISYFSLFLRLLKSRRLNHTLKRKWLFFLVDIAPGTSNPWNLYFQSQIVTSKNIFFSRRLTINFFM